MKNLREKLDTKAGIYSIGCTTITIFAFLSLLLAIFYLGAFVASGLVFFVKGSTIENELIARFYSYITYLGENDALATIKLVGQGKAEFALLAYAFTYSIHYGLIFVILYKFKDIFKTIVNENLFTLKNIDSLDELIKVSLFLSFIQPVFMVIIILTSHVFLNFSSFNFSGIMFLFVSVLLYMVIIAGYNLQIQNDEVDAELEDYKAQLNDLEIEKLKTKTQTKTTSEENTTAPKKRRRRKKKPATKTEK